VRRYLIIASESLVSGTGTVLIRTHVATGSIASYKTKPRSISGCSSPAWYTWTYERSGQLVKLELSHHIDTIEEIPGGLLGVLVDELQESLKDLYPLLERDGGRSR